ncbi:hypothetical protein D9613_003704 [Agrocybe pediades]|uniref:Uncharacterized protein n=1 Tax=Agrocybe pediades TaxID=84607 RepID=A0A8H4QK62_9AGAR|nr:hypothetical protein D9613_003704 [Agrocybe pediades]KAF9542534.1 hypothetical protein CPC08DRAFT_756047 [Agrocybe pediades]KAF9546452.1 hypothetical protein CPC08DRAFT_755586 [Agrocybe pediades]
MPSFLKFLRDFVHKMHNQPKRRQSAQHTVQYVMIFNHDVYFNHDQSVHRPHNGNIFNHDYSFHSLNSGNWTSNNVTNTSTGSMENASTVITNGNSTGGFEVPDPDDNSDEVATGEPSRAAE